jgi:cell division protein FtsI/penicillin-binding protein 2
MKPLQAPAGAGVVFDTTNGEILAMASYPTYDPNDFVRGIDQRAYAQKYGDQQLAPLTNRAITTRYSPASTFKVFTAMAGLLSGYITPEQQIMDNGVYTLPDCVKNPALFREGVKCRFSNAGKTPHGPVNTTLSMIVSSDVYYYDLSQRIWTGAPQLRNAIQDVARNFGLGDRTTVRLPYEKASPIPSPEVKRRRHELNPEVWPDPNYRTGDNLNLAIGQGEMAVTVLNLAAGYSAFANGGTLYVPQISFATPAPPDGGVIDLEALRLEAAATSGDTVPAASSPSAGPSASSSVSPSSVSSSGAAPSSSAAPSSGAAPSSVVPPDTTVAAPRARPTTSTTLVPPADLEPVVRRRIALPDSVRAPILEGLVGVTTSRYGTARDAFDGFPARWTVAGKTGTAQTNRQDNALFVGFAPAGKPRYTVAIVLEQAGFGGQTAAPVARRVFNVLAGEPPGALSLVRSKGAIDR